MSLWSSFSQLYLSNLPYFATNLLFSIIIHIFIVIVLIVLTKEKYHDLDSATYTHSNKLIQLIKRTPLYLARMALGLIASFNGLALLYYKHLRGQGLGTSYILFGLVSGFGISLLILGLVEVNYFVSFSIYLFWITLVLLYLIGLGQIRRLESEIAKELKIGFEGLEIIVGKQWENNKKRLEGRIALLGLSLHAGIIGILTTVGGSILEEPITFVLVPTTFDMVSVTAALLEFPGLKKIVPTLKHLKGLFTSLLAVVLSIALSIMITTIIWSLDIPELLAISDEAMTTLVSLIWAFMAVLVSLLVYRPRQLTPAED